jgi:pyridoxal phosphate-dependent aminotransferase EpsN
MGGDEFEFVREAFATNWIAPVGPHVDAFEREFAALVGSPHAVALSSGTAALHLALRMMGAGPGDEVFCSDLTFSASANPIVYEGAKPVFIDCDRATWNMDPARLAEALEDRARQGRRPKAVILVHLYGQSADIDPVLELCERHGVVLIEDAAEALGATYKGAAPGTRGRMGIFSFNGNKIITTSGGGMLVAADGALTERARFLATQARDPAPHYQHSQTGYNYRLSNVLAGIGRGQLHVLEDRVRARRANCAFYQAAFADLPGLEFMPEAAYGRATRWLTCIVIDPEKFGCDRETVRIALAAENIEARPVWKPMHEQPVFAGCDHFGGAVASDLFARGLCLPSGSNLHESDLRRVVAAVRACARR